MLYDLDNLCQNLAAPLKAILIALQEDNQDKAIDICLKSLKIIGKLHPLIRIYRLEQTSEGALGSLVLDNYLFCSTLEPDSKDPTRTQIPEGIHLCQKRKSPKFGWTIEVLVPDHTHVLFHPGNTEEDTTMCIILGQYPGKLREKRAVLNSGETFAKFMAVMNLKKLNQFYIEFINCFEKGA